MHYVKLPGATPTCRSPRQRGVDDGEAELWEAAVMWHCSVRCDPLRKHGITGVAGTISVYMPKGDAVVAMSVDCKRSDVRYWAASILAAVSCPGRCRTSTSPTKGRRR